jgi:hypothetical protein
MKGLNTTAVTSGYNEARDELSRIAETEGVLSPRTVVNVARDEENPLHDYFIWDDTEAAERYRINQASLLIRRVKIDIIKPNKETRELEIKTTRKFVSPKSLRGNNGSYKPVESVLNDEDLKNDLLETAKAELYALKKKYEALVELTIVWEAIGAIQ